MTNPLRNPTSSGFTLVEIVAAIVLFGIIGAMVSRLLAQGFTAYITGRNIAETDWQGRVALERFTREVRNIRAPSDITITSASDFSFVDVDGTTIRYCLGAVGTCPGATGELMRNTQSLAYGISSVTFSYLTKTNAGTVVPAQIFTILASFTATQGAISKDYTVAVSPRNFP